MGALSPWVISCIVDGVFLQYGMSTFSGFAFLSVAIQRLVTLWAPLPMRCSLVAEAQKAGASCQDIV